MQAVRVNQYLEGETYSSSMGTGIEGAPVSSGEDILKEYGASSEGESVFQWKTYWSCMGGGSKGGPVSSGGDILEQYGCRQGKGTSI